jgi:hypothetical protein
MLSNSVLDQPVLFSRSGRGVFFRLISSTVLEISVHGCIQSGVETRFTTKPRKAERGDSTKNRNYFRFRTSIGRMMSRWGS